MATFLIETPHKKEDCLKAFDEVVAHNRSLLKKTWFGCNWGDHTAWSLVNTMNEAKAKNMLPSSHRSKARVHRVAQNTVKQIQAFHK